MHITTTNRLICSPQQLFNQGRERNQGNGGLLVGHGIGDDQHSVVQQHAAGVYDVRDIPRPAGLGPVDERLPQAAEYFRRIFLVQQGGADRVLADGPTPWVMSSQPCSVSIGEPQFPIWMNSHGYEGGMPGLNENPISGSHRHLNPSDLRPQLFQFPFPILVTPVQMVDPVDLGPALGRQGRDHQGRRGP